MDDNETETTDTLTDTEGEQSPEDSQDESVTSNDNADSEQENAETTEPEKDTEPAKPEVKKEETFEERVNRLAQSKADKAVKTYQKTTEDLRKENETLKSQLNDRTWDRNIQSLFDEESESKGEDEATKRKAAREDVKKQVLEYQQNKAYVDKTKPELEKRESVLNFVERDQKAQNEIWKVIFPEDKAKIERVNALVKRFEKAQDLEDFEIILEGIKGELKGKASPARKPDSGRNGGSGGVDLSKLSARELFVLGQKKKGGSNQ